MKHRFEFISFSESQDAVQEVGSGEAATNDGPSAMGRQPFFFY